MKIILKSNVLKVTKVLRKTKAEVFKDLEVGNTIRLSIPVKGVGRGHRGTYANYITIENLEGRRKTKKSFNQIEQCLNCFEFEEVQEDTREEVDTWEGYEGVLSVSFEDEEI